MKAHDLVAKTSDWIFSSLIDHEKPKPKTPRIVLEIQDHTTAPSTATLQPTGRGCKRHRARSGNHTYGSKSIFACRPMSCAVAAMVALVHWIEGVDVLEQINERFPPMNNIGLSFAMLSSVEIVHELIDWEFLPVEAMI